MIKIDLVRPIKSRNTKVEWIDQDRPEQTWIDQNGPRYIRIDHIRPR